MTQMLTASKTEHLKDAGSKAWWAKPRPEDTEMGRFAEGAGGDGLRLQEKLDCLWEGLLASGVAVCPACAGRMERTSQRGRCRDCGSTLS